MSQCADTTTEETTHGDEGNQVEFRLRVWITVHQTRLQGIRCYAGNNNNVCPYSKDKIVNPKSPIHLAYISALLWNPVAQADWRATPTFGAGFESNDNANLTPDSALEESISGFGVNLGAVLAYQSQLTTFELKPSIDYEQYDESEYDTTNEFLKFELNNRGQRYRLRFRGDLSNEVIRQGELGNVDFDAEDPSDIPVDDSGQTFSNNDRLRIVLAPEWQYDLTERANIGLFAEYVRTDFEEDPGQLGNDFAETEIGAEIGFDLSPRDNVGLQVYARETDFSGGEDISGTGVGAFYRRSVSENTDLEFLLGVDQTEDINGEDESNPIGVVSFVRKYETGRLLGSFRRVVSGNGGGIVSVRDQLDLRGTRNLTERWSLGVGARAYQTDALQGDATAFDARDYVQVRGELAWRATQTWTIELNYRFTQLERDSFLSEADSNRFSLWFRYKPLTP